MFQKKKKEEEAALPFNIVLMHRYKDLKTKTARWKTDNSHQKRYRQQKNQQNWNNQKTKVGRKTSVYTLQATNKQSLTWENLDRAKKGKPYEKDGISSHSCTKQRHKDYVEAKKKSTRCNKIADVDYVVIETKRSLA